MLRMKKTSTLLLATICSVGLFSCKSDSEDSNKTNNSIVVGGNLRLNETTYFKTLNPLAVNESSAIHIGSQIFEGLVKFNQSDLSIKPAIAHTYESNATQTIWTFHLRPNAFFHEDPCFKDGKSRAVTAADVKYCFDKLCAFATNSTQFDVTFKDFVIGAIESYEAAKSGKKLPVSGVKITNDSTIQITLKRPYAEFLNVLAMPDCWIYPEEAIAKYGSDIDNHPVGSGPFYLANFKKGTSLTLKKNNNYYGLDNEGNKLPYLDEVNYSFISDKKAEILEFKSGNLDMVYGIPFEIFHDLMGDVDDAKKRKNDFQIFNSQALKSTSLGFNLSEPSVFSKKEVRLAFNYAIDRRKISEFIYHGEVAKAEGVVPIIESFEKAGYDYKSLKSNEFNVVKAQEYLKQAGFPNGKGFPKLKLQTNIDVNGRNILLVENVKKMLKENLNIDIEVVTSEKHYQTIVDGGVDFFCFSWTGNSPDPENFLRIFYGKNNVEKLLGLNLTNFNNTQFDSLLLVANAEPNKSKRYSILSKAEKIIMDEVPVIPIYYDENLRLERSSVKNFPENAINYIDLSVVHLTHVPAKK